MIYAENILICIAVPLIVSLFFLTKSAKRFVSAFVTGMIICLISAYISGFIEYASKWQEGEAAIFLSPIVEESMKIVPVLFYLLIFTPKNSYLLLFSIGIGAGFATFENCCYILSSGADKLPFILIRGLAVGVMHIVCTVMLALAMILLRKYKALSAAGVAGALSLSMIFHALYNLLVSESGVSSYIGYTLPLLYAVIMLIPYKKHLKDL
ncbi:MAG: PrsW family intramembrane metalloprotease [Lachnospiraceae bacterium]|nr:PrsW family intramembrane metalloprotease [Lachnospiraceae bacterium]